MLFKVMSRVFASLTCNSLTRARAPQRSFVVEATAIALISVVPACADEAESDPDLRKLIQECTAEDFVPLDECLGCGDGLCGPDETPESCAVDCSHCGDGVCNGFESTAWCPGDCGSACGDGVCNGQESVDSCISDCASKLTEVVLDRVRYCRNGFVLCNSALSRPQYHWWDHFGVANEKQKRTYLSRASEPPRDSVRHLVFLAAGQSDFFDNDLPSMVTGQTNTYKNEFKSTTASDTVPLMPGSLGRRLVEELHVDPDETFIGMAFDARFNYDFFVDNKQEIEDAYYAWLNEKFNADGLESIYLAGHSRGGCLVMRLARRFNADHPEIPLIVHVFDGVCKHGKGELNTGDAVVDNPLTDGNFYARAVDMSTLFGDETNLRVLNFVSGAQVLIDLPLNIGGGIRAFAHLTTEPEAVIELGDWYEQRWNTLTHFGIGLDAGLVAQALAHRAAACAELGC